jgi:hypothetical protein
MSEAIDRAVADASTWVDLPGVALVGQGETSDGNPCIIVKVVTEEVARKIPSTFQGFPVIVEPTDEILAQRRRGTKTSGG